MSDYFCPNCGADLENQPGFDPNAGYWTCTNCGTLLTDPDDPDMDTPSGATWFCDCCGACLNKQYGFDENYSSWTCTECGHINNLSGDDIYSSEEEYQNSITHYNCPSCGAELNKQPSFYEEDEYTCESCGEELYKDGGEYVKKYTCPHCGATLNSQWGFNTWSNYFSCSNCGSQLYKSGDEYEEEQQDQNEVDSADGYDESDEDTYEEDDESDDDDFSSRQTTSQFRDVNTSAEHEDFSKYYKSTFREKSPTKKKSFGRRHWKGILISIVLIFLAAVITFGVYEYKKLIPMELNSKQILGMRYETVASELQRKGFSNIHTKEIEDLEYADINEEGNVESITVQPLWFLPAIQEDSFTRSDRFPYDSLIQITYHGLMRIATPVSSKEAKKQDYKDIEQLFEDAGFVNVKTEKDEDLITGWINKDGAVEKVSIGGKTKFEAQDMFRPDAEVVITYHTFKQ